MNTAAGIDREKLSKDGLRGHEVEASEFITFLGFADDENDNHGVPLLYRYEDEKGRVQERRFGVGEKFASVETWARPDFGML